MRPSKMFMSPKTNIVVDKPVQRKKQDATPNQFKQSQYIIDESDDEKSEHDVLDNLLLSLEEKSPVI